jgi:hypothetical protein
VSEIPAIAGGHALIPTAEEAVTELANVFVPIEEEYRANGLTLPRDTTEIAHAERPRRNSSGRLRGG